MEIILTIIVAALAAFMFTGILALIWDTTSKGIQEYKHNKRMKAITAEFRAF
jgi:succinate dehydrogenase/fumarate reductase cytochrome b subunit